MAANASVITLEKRGISAPFSIDYKAGWNAQTSTVSTTTPASFSGQQLAGFGKLTVDFDLSAPTSILFQLGLDAGYGGEIWMDTNLLQRKTGDIWWAGNWNNTAHVFSTTPLALGAGNHVFTAYWAEGCCNGPNAGRFSIDNGQTWQVLSVANLDTLAVAQVSEPGALALAGIALLGFARTRRRKPAQK